METKFLVKFKDGVIRGPLLESEIDDMIYDNILTGEEEICEHPGGDWIKIATAPHFYDVFLGAFEIEKGRDRAKKDTFVDSSTSPGAKEPKKKKELEETVVQDKGKKEPEPKEGTELYDEEDLKDISDSLIKKKKEAVIEPEQKSPIIPQAVIVSLDDKKKKKDRSLKLILIIIIAVIGFLLFNPFAKKGKILKTINIDGVSFEKITIEITLPVAESDEYAPNESKKLQNRALKLMRNDDINSYKISIEQLLEAFELDTSNITLLSYLAYCYSRLYNVSKKDSEYLNALKVIIARAERGDTNIQTMTLAKMAYMKLVKDYSGAIAVFDELLTSVPDISRLDPQLLIMTAEISMENNDYNSAFQIISKVNQIVENNYPRSYYIEGLIRINNREYETAAELFNRALKINPKHTASRVKLFELGRDATAFNIFDFIKKHSTNISHDDTSVLLYLLGNLMMEKKNTEKANHFYEKALDFSPSNLKALMAYEQLGGDISKYKKEILSTTLPNIETSTFLMRGDELSYLQKYRDASLQYRMAASLDSRNSLAWYKLAESYRMTYEYAKAIDAYTESLKIDKLAINSLVKLARVQIELYQFQDAFNGLKKAQEIDPENPDVLYTIGFLNDKRNLEGKAVENYHKAVSYDFSHVPSLFELGKKNFYYKRYPEAKLLFEKVLSVQPDHFESYMYIARILSQTEHISKVRRYTDNLKRSFPRIAEISTAMALAYMDNFDYPAAENELKEALAKNKYSIHALETYAELNEKLGRHKEALTYLETISIIAPYCLEAINKKAEIYCKLGQLGNCEHELVRLIELTPYYPKAFYRLGELYYRDGKLQYAEEALNREIKHNPAIQDTYLLLGDVYIESNKAAEAVDLFRQMLHQNPKDAYGLLGLAKALYAMKDFGSAKSFLTQAKHVDPSISDIYFVECQLYFYLNMYPESKNSCEEFIKRAPDDPKVNKARKILEKY